MGLTAFLTNWGGETGCGALFFFLLLFFLLRMTVVGETLSSRGPVSLLLVQLMDSGSVVVAVDDDRIRLITSDEGETLRAMNAPSDCGVLGIVACAQGGEEEEEE